MKNKKLLSIFLALFVMISNLSILSSADDFVTSENGMYKNEDNSEVQPLYDIIHSITLDILDDGVDAVLEKMRPEQNFETALVKSTKLNALLNIGNCGQIINLVDNEIMPAFDEFLSKNEPHPSIPMDIVFTIIV